MDDESKVIDDALRLAVENVKKREPPRKKHFLGGARRKRKPLSAAAIKRAFDFYKP